MKHLTAPLRRVDRDRATRLLIAWLDGDVLALDVVVEECMKDPIGTPGILFAQTQFTSSLGLQVAPDFRDQLRKMLLTDDDPDPDDYDGDDGDGDDAA